MTDRGARQSPGPNGRLRFERVSSEDVPAIVRFLETVFATHPLAAASFAGDAGQRRWRWINDEHPVRLTDGPPAWICRVGDRIVGHIGVLPVEAKVLGAKRMLGWARDLIVDPAMRGRGIGSQLMRIAIQAVDVCSVLGYEDAYPLYRRLGYVDMGRLPLLAKPGDPGALASALPGPSPLAAVASRVLHVVRARAPAHPAAPRRVEILDRLDDRFDRWWPEVENAFQCVIRRTSASMNWRYAHEMSHRHRIIGAFVADDLRGIAVVRPGLSRGVTAGFLVEILAHPSDRDTMLRLIAASEAELRRSEPIAFFRAAVLHRSFQDALIETGYVPLPSPIHWIVAARDGPASITHVSDRGEWYLNGGDSDVDLL